MNQDEPPLRAAVYERVLRLCPILRLDPPWRFLPLDDDCRGTIIDPDRALAALRNEFNDSILERAGVVRRSPQGDLSLHPALCNPVGAIVALREAAEQKPCDLLTARGCVSHELPVFAALRDSRTAARIAKTKSLLATPRIREVVILQALGFPASLTWGLHRHDLLQLRSLSETFCYMPAPYPERPSAGSARGKGSGLGAERTEPEVSDVPEKQASQRRSLVLLGWQLLSVRRKPPPWLSQIAAQLAAAQEHLDLDFSQVYAWQPRLPDLETLHYRLGFSNVALVREWLATSADDLYAIEAFADPNRVAELDADRSPKDCVEARAELLNGLADERRSGYRSDEVRVARNTYEALIQRDLIAPLQQWGLSQECPVVRNLALQLADVSALVHRMSPTLHEVQSRDIASAGPGDTAITSPKLTSQYLQLVNQVNAIIKILLQRRATL